MKKPHIWSTVTSSSVLLTFALLATGCAVMRIDVDVYKGPLANHREVQIKQFSAMATGAKPLLLQLRDNLIWAKGCDPENGYPKEPGTGAHEKRTEQCRNIAIEKGNYREDDTRIDPKYLSNPEARQVQAVLTLYDDLGAPSLQPFLDAVNETADAYSIAMLPSPDEDKKVWTKIKSGFKPEAKNDYECLVGLFYLILDPTGWKAEQSKCKEEDESPKRQAEATRQVPLAALGKANEPLIKKSSEDSVDSRYIKGLDAFKGLLPKAKPIWESFELGSLRNKNDVEQYANLLFINPSGEEAKTFKDQMGKQAEAFERLKAATQNLWRITLGYLSKVDPSKNLASDKEKHVAAMANIMGEFTNPLHVAVALRAKTFDSSDREKLINLLTAGASNAGIWNPKKTFPYRRTNRAIELAFLQEPKKMALLFEHLDELFRSSRNEDFNFGEKGDLVDIAELYKHKNQRHDGLVRRLTTKSDDAEESLSSAIKNLGTITFGIALGLDRGRPAHGLETLIESSLQREYSSDRSKMDPELTDALISFSQKVLFLANNQELFSSNGSREKNHQSILILQAIGNTILAEADELTHEEGHQKQLGKRADAESFAAKDSVTKDARASLDNVVSDLTAKRQEAQKETETAEKNLVEAIQTVGLAATQETEAGQEVIDKEGSEKVATSKLADESKDLRLPFHAARTLGGDALATNPIPCGEKSLKWQECDEPLQGMRNDSQSLKAAAIGDNAKVKPEVIVQRIRDWMTGKITTNVAVNDCRKSDAQFVSDDLRQIRLKCTEKYFDPASEPLKTKIGGINEAPAQEVWSKLLGIVKDHYEGENGRSGEALKSLISVRDAVDKARNQKIDASAGVAAAKEGQGKLTDVRDQAKGKLRRMAHAVDVLKEYRVQILGRLDLVDTVPDARSVWNLLLVTIAESVRTAETAYENGKTDANKVTRLQEAFDELSKLTPPPSMAVFENKKEKDNQRDVLDNLIATLRHEHIQATRRGTTSIAKSIEEALKLAYDQRSGMAYIRPAGAYLRSSYAATGLQNDPGLGWENMLEDHAKRNFKFLNTCDSTKLQDQPGCDDYQRVKTLSRIDKQFWQNINSVRVAGGGRTNYAIVKDDIGNWYVKGYSADPSPIIQSAQRLALFGVGGKFDANLMRRLDLEQKVSAGNANSGEITELGQLQKQGPKGYNTGAGQIFNRYNDDYLQRAQKDLEELRGRIENKKLSEKTTGAWSTSVKFPDDPNQTKKSDFLKLLDEALKSSEPSVEEAVKALQSDQPSVPASDAAGTAAAKSIIDKESPEKIGRSLRHLRRFEANLQAKITQLDVSKTAGPLLVARQKLTDEQAILAKLDAELVKRAQTRDEEIKVRDALLKGNADASAKDAQDQVVKSAESEVGKASQGALDAKKKIDEATAAVTKANVEHEAMIKNRDSARADVSTIATALLLDFVDRRKKAADSFEQSVVFIGDGLRN